MKTNESFSKIWWSKSWYLQSLIKHGRVRVFEKINVVLNALFVALWLVEAELQVLQTHLELFLCLQIKIQTHSELSQIFTWQHISGCIKDEFSIVWYSQWSCSGEEASARCPFCSSRLPAPGFWSEGPLVWRQPGLLPCWPGKNNGKTLNYPTKWNKSPLVCQIFIGKYLQYQSIGVYNSKHRKYKLFQELDVEAPSIVMIDDWYDQSVHNRCIYIKMS